MGATKGLHLGFGVKWESTTKIEWNWNILWSIWYKIGSCTTIMCEIGNKVLKTGVYIEQHKRNKNVQFIRVYSRKFNGIYENWVNILAAYSFFV